MKRQNGITMIALIITIILMLILLSVTITSALNGNLFGTAKQAVDETEILNEKEMIDIAIINAIQNSKYGELTEEEIQYQLNINMGQDIAIVSKSGQYFEVLIKDKNRIYTIDEDYNLIGPEEIVPIEFAGDITKNGTLDGSADKPYEIACIEDLVAFSNMTNGTGVILENGTPVAVTKKTDFDQKTIKLITNLNFQSKRSYSNWETTDFGDLNGDDNDGNKLITEMTTGTGFRSINEFCGTFDGSNKKIENLYIHNETAGAGLFGYINKSAGDGYVTIKNLGVSGDVYGNGTTGGIVRLQIYGERVDITNCYFEGIVENVGSGYAGGIVGSNQKPMYITNSYNKADIKSAGAAGGIIGSNYNGYINNCYNEGSVTSVGVAGGICGYECTSIEKCYNVGTVYSSSNGVGGIYGDHKSSKTTISFCFNTGSVTTLNGDAAGIARELTGTVSMCYNTGEITGTSFVARNFSRRTYGYANY